MSAKRCAREECGKSVYPIEELKCLDKVWHKQCFKCTVCGMTLNMKSYKGYDKKPYCEPHYPKTVASVVSDTPEMRRIADNTKNQSQVKYHAEYEKMKGQKIEIADDPETSRHLKNTQAQSQLAYSGELDKRKKMEEVRPSHILDGSGKQCLTSTTATNPTVDSNQNEPEPPKKEPEPIRVTPPNSVEIPVPPAPAIVPNTKAKTKDIEYREEEKEILYPIEVIVYSQDRVTEGRRRFEK